MLYPDNRIYYCKYCGRKFDFSAGFNSPRLIEHLLREHIFEAKAHDNLYLSDLVKTCFESRGGSRV